jgi:DNA topoisomerase-2
MFSAILKKSQREMKVSDFSGFVSTSTSYHHGESSLNECIINMAQDWTGSNNVNLLMPKGQFGTRLGSLDGIGKDSGAPRYIQTCINPIAKAIFNESDFPLYNYLHDDGVKIEPEYYVPILPMILINGGRGIGTGWMTDVPQFNPRDIIENILLFLESKPLFKMIPWYRGYKGTISYCESSGRFNVTGSYSRIGTSRVVITEIPVGNYRETMSYTDYKNYIESLISDDQNPDGILKDSEVLITDKTIKCTVEFKEPITMSVPELEKKLRLCSTINLSNLHLFDEKGIMTKYNSVEDILAEYCKTRLFYYQKRKEHLIEVWEKELKITTEKIRFILYINDLSHELKLSGKRKSEIEELLTRYDFLLIDDSFSYLTKMPIYSLSLEKCEKLENKKIELMNSIDHLKQQSEKDLWKEDINKMALELNIYEKTWEENYST